MFQNFLATLLTLGIGGLILIGVAVILLLRKRKQTDAKKKKSFRDGFISTLVFGVACFMAIAGIMIWFVPIRKESKKYNLITLEATDIPTKQEAVEDDYVQLSDLKMHYVRYGTKGHDVILIHGNGGSADSLKPMAQYLANDYTVYCIDERCQGKSEDPGVITYELMAKDVNEFIQIKGLNKPYVMGHSDGGMVGIALAANYPDSLACLVSCGSNSNPSTFNFQFTFGVQMNNIKNPNKLNNLMLTEPNFTPEYLARIQVPTYVVAGEFDIMPLSDSVYIHNNIQGSEIAIIRWGDHGSYFGDDCQYVYCLTRDFFEKYKVDEE